MHMHSGWSFQINTDLPLVLGLMMQLHVVIKIGLEELIVSPL
jgi:hypothetical protein